MQTVQPRCNGSAAPEIARASVAQDHADASRDETPLWKRIAKGLGRAWAEGSLTADPLAYSYYLIAQAEAQAPAEA